MKITADVVQKVAQLASLPLTKAEEDLYACQLSEILEYIGKLDQVDTSTVEPTYNVSSNISIMFEDQPRQSLNHDEALQNAPHKRDGLFITKGIFAGE